MTDTPARWLLHDCTTSAAGDVDCSTQRLQQTALMKMARMSSDLTELVIAFSMLSFEPVQLRGRFLELVLHPAHKAVNLLLGQRRIATCGCIIGSGSSCSQVRDYKTPPGSS